MEYPHQSNKDVEEESEKSKEFVSTGDLTRGTGSSKPEIKNKTTQHSGTGSSKPERKNKTTQQSFPWTKRMQEELKSTLQRRFQHLIEGAINQGEARLLHEIYTELYITEGGEGEVNDEHEIRQIERASWRKAAEDGIIRCNDLFKHSHRHKNRTILTKGVAGIGKTVSVSKFVLDWADRKDNQDVQFIFPMPLRELNLMSMKKLSFLELIQNFFPEIKDSRVFTHPKCRIMFIFDGLDECRLPLDFLFNPNCCSLTKPASVDILLTNLIKGELLPSALLWITTRPAAANQIPPKFVDEMTEIRGFNDLQKKEYFMKRISDENLASRTIIHLKSSRSLYIMCHIPVFCWISATVVERTLDQSDKTDMPRTLTQMYAKFLIVLTNTKKEKYREIKERDEEIIFKLGKLAFQQLENGNLIFYEEDMMECGIDVTEASVYSGVCTQIFKEESLLCRGKVFSFVHLSIQEFLAALYVFLCFISRERNMSDHQQIALLSPLFRAATLHDLHKTAVNLALLSQNGHLDLFLRFLLGLSVQSNQTVLRPLLPQNSSQPQSSEQIVQYIKHKIRDQNTLDRKINLFYCLNELNHHAIVDVFDRSSGNLSIDMLLPGEWEIRKLEFKITEEQLDGFDLQMYMMTPEKDQTELLSPHGVLMKLFPVATSALLRDCSLTEKSCAALASAAKSTCCLKELDLSYNGLHDAGGQHLSDLLKNPHCKLEKLVLRDCSLTCKSCAAFASVARLSPCHLKELNLCNNKLHDKGVQQLTKLLNNPNCKLEKLVLMRCSLTESSCGTLASAASVVSCHLKELDLSNNKLYDAGVQHLCDLLKNNHCKLEKLTLRYCSLTEKSCASLASVVRSTTSSLKELNLSHNKFCDAAVTQLSDLIGDPHCRLETVIVDHHKFIRAAAAYTSTSPSSDTAELHLTGKTQEDPEPKLRSVNTHKEDQLIPAPQRSCESCAEVPDTSQWILVNPDISMEKSISTYSLSSPAGSYECSESGLRWLCAAPVTLHYCFTNWYVFAEELHHMQMSPAGPLMDIRLMSGELEEIHLPHFLCLGDSEASVCDAVRVLHGRDDGVCMEECELTRHHARLLHPSFSPLAVVYKTYIFLKSLLSTISIHSKVLVYQSGTSALSFRTYLLPEDAHLRQLVEREEKEFGGVWMRKHQPVKPLQMDGLYGLRTDCESEISPGELMLRYSNDTPNFFEVDLPVPTALFHMELFRSADSRGQCVWRAKFKSSDDRLSRPLAEGQAMIGDSQTARIETSGETNHFSTVTALVKHPSPGELFFSEHKAALETRLPSVLASILIPLQHRQVLNDLEREEVQNKSTSTERNHVLLAMIKRKGTTAQQMFYEVLKEADPPLMNDLEGTT